LGGRFNVDNSWWASPAAGCLRDQNDPPTVSAGIVLPLALAMIEGATVHDHATFSAR